MGGQQAGIAERRRPGYIPPVYVLTLILLTRHLQVPKKHGFSR